jgi:hypothetical protein
MKECCSILNYGKCASIIINYFSISKEEVYLQKDIVDCILKCDFCLVGIIVLLQDNKLLYLFDYLYAYKNKSYTPKYNNFRKPKINVKEQGL